MRFFSHLSSCTSHPAVTDEITCAVAVSERLATHNVPWNIGALVFAEPLVRGNAGRNASTSKNRETTSLKKTYLPSRAQLTRNVRSLALVLTPCVVGFHGVKRLSVLWDAGMDRRSRTVIEWTSLKKKRAMRDRHYWTVPRKDPQYGSRNSEIANFLWSSNEHSSQFHSASKSVH